MPATKCKVEQSFESGSTFQPFPVKRTQVGRKVTGK